MIEEPIVTLKPIDGEIWILGEPTTEVDQGWIDTFGEPDRPYTLVDAISAPPLDSGRG